MKQIDWDEEFERIAQETRRANDAALSSPAYLAKRKSEIERDIRQGIRDEAGAMIFPPESQNDSDDEGGEEE